MNLSARRRRQKRVCGSCWKASVLAAFHPAAERWARHTLLLLLDAIAAPSTSVRTGCARMWQLWLWTSIFCCESHLANPERKQVAAASPFCSLTPGGIFGPVLFGLSPKMKLGLQWSSFTFLRSDVIQQQPSGCAWCFILKSYLISQWADGSAPLNTYSDAITTGAKTRRRTRFEPLIVQSNVGQEEEAARLAPPRCNEAHYKEPLRSVWILDFVVIDLLSRRKEHKCFLIFSSHKNTNWRKCFCEKETTETNKYV